MVVNLELEWTFSRSPAPQFKCHRKLPGLPCMLYSAYDIVLSLWPVTHNEGSQNWAINRKTLHLSSSPLPPHPPTPLVTNTAWHFLCLWNISISRCSKSFLETNVYLVCLLPALDHRPNSCAVYIRESTAALAFAGVSPAQSLIHHPSGSQLHRYPRTISGNIPTLSCNSGFSLCFAE